jgi:hypothetical protein
MAVHERSLSEVLQNILRNVQEIVRSEVRLAKTEIRDEAVKAKSATMLLASGGFIGLFAVLFLLLTILFALSLAMPLWAAALIVGAGLSAAAAGILSAGVKRFRRLRATPERTVETVKENVAWIKQHAK